MEFGRDYFIPKLFDKRLFVEVSLVVAKSAVDSGVARKTITDFEAYRKQLLENIPQ